MSINEAVADALTDYAVAWRDSEGVACIKIATELSAAIEQHVAEAVKAERESLKLACVALYDSGPENSCCPSHWNAAIDACIKAIRARADNEVTK